MIFPRTTLNFNFLLWPATRKAGRIGSSKPSSGCTKTWRGPKKKTIKKDHENKSVVIEGSRGKSILANVVQP